MIKFNLRTALVIYLSILLAFSLTIFPLPFSWQWVRPEWVTLILIYWVFRKPNYCGVMTGWTVGLLMDVLGGVLLGQYALAMSILVYLTHLLRNRFSFFLVWQQMFVILVLVGIVQLIPLLVQWLIGHPPRTLLYWSSTLISVILWPLVYRSMNFYERKMT